MQSAELKLLERKGNDAVKNLRKTKFRKGLPFMINSKELPNKQCYLEYPDGRIVLISIKLPTDRDFTFIRELSAAESNHIRLKLKLL